MHHFHTSVDLEPPAAATNTSTATTGTVPSTIDIYMDVSNGLNNNNCSQDSSINDPSDIVTLGAEATDLYLQQDI